MDLNLCRLFLLDLIARFPGLINDQDLNPIELNDWCAEKLSELFGGDPDTCLLIRAIAEREVSHVKLKNMSN